jgi:hypothetical protein
MKRLAYVLLACCLATPMVGCGGSEDSAAPASDETTSTSSSSEFTLVTLKVPNMT